MSKSLFFQQERFEFTSYIKQKQYTQFVILADSKTNGFCVPVLKQILPIFKTSSLIIIPSGEENKNEVIANYLWSELAHLNVSKKTLFVNLGGGMISDIGGFCAATFKRGISFINIPTTLLAMVDAAYGGKTGIDFGGAKNLIGTFCPARAIYIDEVFLKTLPNRILKSGIAEMLKHSILSGGELYKKTIQAREEEFYRIENIQNSIQYKRQIVKMDIYDLGIRQSLNFGHTIGHAIESFSFYRKPQLLHGEAIMFGMIYEAMLSCLLLGAPISIVHELIQFKNRIYPDLFYEFSLNDIEPFLVLDKKNNSDIKMSLIRKVGECVIQCSTNLELIKAAILETNSLLR